MKYDITCRFLWNYVGKKVTKDLSKKRGLSVCKMKRKVKNEYKQMLKRTPDVGDIPLRFNILWGCQYFSFPKAFPDMTKEEFEKATMDMFRFKRIIKWLKKHKKVFADRFINSPRVYKGKNEYDWAYEYKRDDFPKEYYTIYHSCGLLTLAKQEDMLDYLPYFCKLDYFMYDGTDAELIRTKTLARGDECCNFRFINKKFKSREEIMKEEGIKIEDLV
ncbi:MAG: L-2-amino-thiazoline-4-carboxylic acid hydrolase [Tissierellia bacterium]|nr:L-2-amino-thiazoline-4-carboxylic acid hydrolase [Tissierellia bacterium]